MKKELSLEDIKLNTANLIADAKIDKEIMLTMLQEANQEAYNAELAYNEANNRIAELEALASWYNR